MRSSFSEDKFLFYCSLPIAFFPASFLVAWSFNRYIILLPGITDSDRVRILRIASYLLRPRFHCLHPWPTAFSPSGNWFRYCRSRWWSMRKTNQEETEAGCFVVGFCEEFSRFAGLSISHSRKMCFLVWRERERERERKRKNVLIGRNIVQISREHSRFSRGRRFFHAPLHACAPYRFSLSSAIIDHRDEMFNNRSI